MIKILFQGDSITDAGRNREDGHNLAGYSLLVAKALEKKYPNEEFEFINLGISGNRTADLVERYESDFKAINPDIVSIMIGVNDVWHYFDNAVNYVSPAAYEHNYAYILEGLKRDTKAKILMIEPYLLPAPDKENMRQDINAMITRCRSLAVRYADEYIPTDGLFAKACVHTPWQEMSGDGVHPSEKGQQILAGFYIDAVSKLIDEIMAERK